MVVGSAKYQERDGRKAKGHTLLELESVRKASHILVAFDGIWIVGWDLHRNVSCKPHDQLAL